MGFFCGCGDNKILFENEIGWNLELFINEKFDFCCKLFSNISI